MTRVPEIGERFELPDEGIYGVVDQVVQDDDGDPASLVIECDDGQWAAVALNAIEFVPATIH